MILYIFIVIILSFFSYLGCSHIKTSSLAKTQGVSQFNRMFKLEHILCFIMLLLFWLLTAFRSINIGNDTNSYIRAFVSINNSGPNESIYMESGFQYFNYIIGYILGFDSHSYLIICASICYVPIIYFIFKYSENYYISTCLFFCLFFSLYTNVIRQGIAIVIGLSAYFQIKNGKRLIPIIMILCAMQFHTSAVVLFVLFCGRLLPKKLSHCVLICAILLVISILGIPNKFIEAILPRYSTYFESDRVGTGYLALSYELFINSVFCWYGYNSSNMNEDTLLKEDELVKSVLLGSLFLTCLSFNMNLISRSNYYLTIVVIIELPRLIRAKNENNKQLYMWCIIVLMLVYFLVAQYYRPEWNHLYPYEFW